MSEERSEYGRPGEAHGAEQSSADLLAWLAEEALYEQALNQIERLASAGAAPELIKRVSLAALAEGERE